MNEQTIGADILETYPAVDEEKTDQLLKKEIDECPAKIIVLDDDPTGVQTVHDVSVYTDWTKESIRQGLEERNRMFYILTNSRGLTEEQTIKVHRTIAENIVKASEGSGVRIVVMSRSDSTLRGHYPTEPLVLKEVLEEKGFPALDGEILCPFFKEGGRFTVNDVHYVKYGDELVPAGETEFATDKTFGYRSSNIREYVEEKTKGKHRAGDVISVSLDSLRNMKINEITGQLMAVKNFNKIVVNAVDYTDLKVFSTAVYRAMAQGKNFMFRTAAGLAKVMGGVTDIPLLTRKDMVTKETDTGGIVVAGSHTKKTTAQLEQLLTLECVTGIHFHSDLILQGEKAFSAEIDRVVKKSEKVIRSGKTAVCYTDRRVITVENETKEEALLRSVRISEGVQALVGNLSVTPAFVVAKGGITSSDVGTKALRVKRADVMGQVKPGIPVWKTGDESKFPQTPYVIFPGNVGEVQTLKEVVQLLTESWGIQPDKEEKCQNLL